MDKREKEVIRGHKEKDRQPNGQKRKGSSEAIKRRTDNPMDKRERVIRGHKEKGRQPNGQTKKGSSEVKKRRTDNPMDQRERGHQRSKREEWQTTQWTNERGVIRGHKDKNDRQPIGQKRKGSSEAIKRRRTDNPMDKRERGHQRP